MATSGANYSTAGTDRFNGIHFLLHQGCTTLLRAVVIHYVKLATPGTTPWSLSDFLMHNRKHIEQTNKLVEKQYKNVLYPPDGSESNLDGWDVYLLCQFIRLACKPSPTVFMDMSQIKSIRNKLSHCCGTNLDETFYNTYRGIIQVVMDRTLKMLKDDELAKCIRELRLVADAEVPKNPNLVPCLLDLCEDHDEIHKKLDHFSADHKEILSMLRHLVSRGDRETDIFMYLRHCTPEQQGELGKTLVELIDPAVRKDARLNSELSPESIESLKTIVETAMKELCTNGRTVVSAVNKCVAIRVRCATVGSLCDLFEQSVNGELTRIFLPVQTFLRTLPGYKTLKMDVHVTQKSFSMSIQEIVNDLLQSESEVRDTHNVETETMESCIKKVTVESYGPSEEKRIRIHIKPSSDEHLQHIREICRSGQLNKHLAEVAAILKSVYGSNLAITAELQGESSRPIDTDSMDQRQIREENRQLLQDILKFCKRSDYKSGENIVLLGRSGAGKSALINTVCAALSGTYLHKATAARGVTRTKTFDLQWFPHCGLTKDDIRDSPNEDILQELLPVLPNIFDAAGMGDEDTPEREEILRLLLGGYIQPGTNIQYLENLQMVHGVGNLNHFYDTPNPVWQVHKVVFVQSGSELVSKNLVKCILRVLGITSLVNAQLLCNSNFFVMTKYDLVDVGDDDDIEILAKPALRSSSQSEGEKPSSLIEKRTIKLKDFASVENRVAKEFSIQGQLQYRLVRWKSFCDDVGFDNPFISNTALKFVKLMVTPERPQSHVVSFWKLKTLQLQASLSNARDTNVQPGVLLMAFAGLIFTILFYYLFSKSVSS